MPSKSIVGSAAALLLGAFALVVLNAREHNESFAEERAREHGRGRDDEARELKQAAVEAEFWDWRVSYPTGQFSAAWYREALPQHERLQRTAARSIRGAETLAPPHGVLTPLQATSLGPSPLDWSTTYGLVAGRTTVLLTHPTQPNVAWFGSDGGGVWKTTNCCSAATTWQAKTDLPQVANIAIGALAMDPNNSNVIYAGTGDFRRNRPFTFGAGGLLKSVDGGESWTVLGQDVFNPVYSQGTGQFPQYRAMSAVVVDPNASARLVVGTNQGLYVSYDTGANWTGPCFTNAFGTQRQDITGLVAIDSGTTTKLVAAVGALGRVSTVRNDLRFNGANGVYTATLGATGCPTFTLISRADNGWPAGSGSGIPIGSVGGNPLRRIDLAVAPSDSNVIYAQVMNLGVWRSTDGGSTWTQRATQPDDFATGCANDAFASGMNFQDYNAGMMVSPTDANTVFLNSTDTWRSINGADTFTNLTCGYDELTPGVPGNVHVDQHARAIVNGDASKLLIGTDGGVYYSANALAAQPTFTAMNQGASTIEFYSGDLTARFNDAAGPHGISGGAQDNGSSNYVWPAGTPPQSAAWTVRFDGDGIFSQIEPMLAQTWYYSSQFGFIGASVTGPAGVADQQVSPQNASQALWNGDRTGFLTPFELYHYGDASTCPPTGCTRMLAGTYRVYESVSGGLPSTSWYINSPDLTKNLAAGNDLSIINKVVHAYSDAAIAVVGTNDGNVWMGFGLGQGTANSATWVNVTNGNTVLPNRPVMDVVTDPVNPLTAYAALTGFDQNTPATPGHVYRLTCSAGCVTATWENKSGNLPNIPVNAVMINPNLPKQAFVGTDWGLYATSDITAATPVWSRLDIGVPTAMIWDLVVDRGATTLAIFTRSRGAYVWPLPLGDRIFADGFER